MIAEWVDIADLAMHDTLVAMAGVRSWPVYGLLMGAPLSSCVSGDPGRMERNFASA